MALIKCPECGHDVSDQAAACPNCGYPVSKITMQHKSEYDSIWTDESQISQRPAESKMQRFLMIAESEFSDLFTRYRLCLYKNKVELFKSGKPYVQCPLEQFIILYFIHHNGMRSGTLVFIIRGMKKPLKIELPYDEDNFERQLTELLPHCKVRTQQSYSDAMACRVDDTGALWSPHKTVNAIIK